MTAILFELFDEHTGGPLLVPDYIGVGLVMEGQSVGCAGPSVDKAIVSLRKLSPSDSPIVLARGLAANRAQAARKFDAGSSETRAVPSHGNEKIRGWGG